MSLTDCGHHFPRRTSIDVLTECSEDTVEKCPVRFHFGGYERGQSWQNTATYKKACSTESKQSPRFTSTYRTGKLNWKFKLRLCWLLALANISFHCCCCLRFVLLGIKRKHGFLTVIISHQFCVPFIFRQLSRKF